MTTTENSRADALTPCIHADDPKACHRVRCQLGRKCIDDDMSPRQPAAAPIDPRAHRGNSVGDWLWCELMDYCRERGMPPASNGRLFSLVDRARAAWDSQPAPSPADERAALPSDMVEYLYDLARGYTKEKFERNLQSLFAARAASANETVAEGATWYDRWQAECTRDHGEYDENAPISDRLRWWVPKSARHGTILLEDDLREAANGLLDVLIAHPVQPEPRAEVTDCGCATNEACKMKTDGSCWRAD